MEAQGFCTQQGQRSPVSRGEQSPKQRGSLNHFYRVKDQTLGKDGEQGSEGSPTHSRGTTALIGLGQPGLCTSCPEEPAATSQM